MGGAAIHDVSWAPLSGRSFHMVVTAAEDRKIVVWRLQVVDLMSEQPDTMFEEPKVTVMFSIGPPAAEPN